MAEELVLVVEDNPMNLELASDLLKLAGYRVLQASSAEEGLHLAEEQRPALILMDIGLPGMDGLEATRLLRTHPELKHIAVIALTAHAMRGDGERALEAGCDHYIAKPIDTRAFIAQVREVLDRG